MKLPRFSIRDLFWLVLVVATGCAWWVDSRITENEQLNRSIQQLREIEEALDAQGFELELNTTEPGPMHSVVK